MHCYDYFPFKCELTTENVWFGRFNVSQQCDYELLHYLVALPFEVATPAAISTGIEVWTWVIAEKNDIEVALMSEILSAWSYTIRQEKGIFSTSLKLVVLPSSLCFSDSLPT